MRLPRLCTAASTPNAEPRTCSGASVATAACSAVSTQPMPMPARANAAARRGDARAGGCEAGVGEAEGGDAGGQYADHAALIAEPAGRDAGERGGEVVDDVERGRELRRVVGAAAEREQIGGTQDQQRGGDVAQLEHRDPGHQAAEPAVQDRSHVQADRPVLATCESEQWRLQTALDRVDGKLAELNALRTRIVDAQNACAEGQCKFKTPATGS